MKLILNNILLYATTNFMSDGLLSGVYPFQHPPTLNSQSLFLFSRFPPHNHSRLSRETNKYYNTYKMRAIFLSFFLVKTFILSKTIMNINDVCYIIINFSMDINFVLLTINLLRHWIFNSDFIQTWTKMFNVMNDFKASVYKLCWKTLCSHLRGGLLSHLLGLCLTIWAYSLLLNLYSFAFKLFYQNNLRIVVN